MSKNDPPPKRESYPTKGPEPTHPIPPPRPTKGPTKQADWLTVADVAQVTGWHPDTVRRRLESGEMHGHQRSRRGRWQIHSDAVDACIRGLDGPTACGCARLQSVTRGRRALAS